MQRLGKSLARLGPARALLAGAAILAGAAGPVGGKGGGDAPEDIALAIPRISAPGGSTRVALPQPLSPSEAERIRRIFALQAKNDIPAAIAETEKLTDLFLLSDILADRFLGGTGRRFRSDDLVAWLGRYADLPDAAAIRAMLEARAPGEAARFTAADAMPALPQASSGDDVEPVERWLVRAAWLDRSVHETARTSSSRALRLIARTKGISRLYGAQLRAEVAQVLFTQGRDAEALAIALDAGRQAGGEIGLAPFVAGLAAWRLDRRDLAEAQFEASFKAVLAQPGQRAGAAFWAARAAQGRDDQKRRRFWLRRASENGRTFYGLLARRSLGHAISPESLEGLTIGEADIEAVDATTAGRRAFALLQVGQDARASRELQSLWGLYRDTPSMVRSIMLVAKQAGLAGLSNQLAMLVDPPPVRLPRRELRPLHGFRTDKALLYALVRLESNFDPRAVSRAGARGLMQLMPSTVQFILGDDRRRAWHDPAVSLELGQRYLLMLAQYDLIGGDLIRLLAGYNSGPGSLGKWIGGIQHNGDPLLFMESIPNDETRAYVPRALAYSWLYAAELKLASPSLDDLSAGAWPRFQYEDRRGEVVVVQQ